MPKIGGLRGFSTLEKRLQSQGAVCNICCIKSFKYSCMNNNKF